MPSAVSLEEVDVLELLIDLLRDPAQFHCRFELPPPDVDGGRAAQVVADAGDIIYKLRARRRTFPEIY